MKIHFIFHERFEGPGCIEKWASEKKYQWSVTRTYANGPFPDMQSFDWLIIMGGGMSVYEEEKYAFLKDEKKFIDECVKQGKTILGICLGSQLLADVLGSKVYPAKEKEIGWFPVNIIRENLPPELRTLPEVVIPLHWHGDTFVLPEKSIRLASSEITPNQAFLHKHNVMALQYHYEIDNNALDRMLNHAYNDNDNGPYIQSREQILKGADNIELNNSIMFSILDYLEANTEN